MRYVFVEIFGLFWLTSKTPEWPKNDPKIVKTAKFSNFYRFYAIFVEFLIDFVALNDERENFRYPRGYFREMNATLKRKNASNCNRNWKNFQEVQIITVFMQFLSNFWYTC